MALRELVLALERDALAGIAAARDEASAEAERLRAESRVALARRRAVDLATREAELKAAAAGAIDAARREAAQRSLAARAKALDAILARARALLAATVPDAGMKAGIQRDLEAALAYLGGAEAVVRCPARWAPAVEAALAGRPGVRLEQSEQFTAGLVAWTADGRAEIDATLDTRLTRLWPTLAVELMRDAERAA
jgi:vacuolar-type H+-ATPase subunit E/Vma4